MSVISKHKDYDKMHERWVMCRDAAEGEHAVHLKREQYLPRLKEEDDDSYKLRLMMTPFFNATWRTIAGLRGMLFRKPPKTELTTRITDAELDIDLAGTTLLSLAQEVVEEALIVGRVGLLVDFPPASPGTTLADQKAAGLRTLISVYEAESIYNWKLDRINGATVLVQVRLTEDFTLESEDEFTSKCEKRYRILDLRDGKYRQRVYRVDEKGFEVQVGGDIIPLKDGAPLPFIPFVVMGVDDVGMDVDAPPLIDLVTTNFHHYLQATSYERGCFFSGLPTMFISGMEDSDKEISIGGNVANALGSPNAKAYYVEVSSKFEALRTNLEDKKKEMAVLGARMLRVVGQVGRQKLLRLWPVVSLGRNPSWPPSPRTSVRDWSRHSTGSRGGRVRMERSRTSSTVTSCPLPCLLRTWEPWLLLGSPGPSASRHYSTI